MIEFQVSFVKGRGVGTRSTRTIIVNAIDTDTAITHARERFRRDYPGDSGRGYRLAQVWSSENGLELL